jgi:hypothetical protein
MNEMLEQWWRKLKSGERDSQEHQRGQSLIIVVLAFIGILALIGLGVDLGLVYVERVRVARAADAAALAAVAELPLEEAAHLRALIYLQENGYDYTRGNTYTTLNWDNSPRENLDHPGTCEADCLFASVPCDPTPADCSDDPSAGWNTAIWVDTAYSRMEVAAGVDDTDTSDRVRVRVRKLVPMTFLQFIGWRVLPVEATAEAENVSKLDIVIVYDKSGSMEFSTLCYGCWTDNTDPWVDPEIHPLLWSYVGGETEPPDYPDHCAGWERNPADPYGTYDCGGYTTAGVPSGYEKNNCNYRENDGGSDTYIVIEAEEYSQAGVHPPGWPATQSAGDYHNRTAYSTFWVMQRNGQGSEGGGYISHHPFSAFSSANPDRKGVSCATTDVQNGGYCRTLWSSAPAHSVSGMDDNVPGGPYLAPRADYDFYVPSTGTYYFWIRGQGGSDNNIGWHIYWGVDQAYGGMQNNFPDGADYDGANPGRWEWRRLGSQSFSAGTRHTFNLWGGGAGFDVDRIVITTDPDTKGAYDPADSLPNDFDEMENAVANDGRTRDACHYCDPRFAGFYPEDADGDDVPDNFDELKVAGGTQWLPWCHNPDNPGWRPPFDNREDEIYKGEQPVYDAVQAAKGFVATIDPQLGQVAYVTYDSNVWSGIRSGNGGDSTWRPYTELECLRSDGPETPDDPGCVDNCWNHSLYPLGGDCDPDCGCYSSVITNTVIYRMDQTTAGGGTNIAQGIRAGTDLLATGDCNPQECGRRGAAKIMIVLTDGHANTTSGCGTPPTDLVPDLPGYPSDWNTARECTAWRAQQAGAQGIIIYSITLGDGADEELMAAVAQLGNGEYIGAGSSDQLVAVFEELFNKIFLRLIS